jgi:uncharacterized protein YnzC (UPF0291/DUF896 family)
MVSTTTIDLHVHAFMRNTSGFKPHELVELSIERLEIAIKQAAKNNLSELQVIHGKGRGVLKEKVYQRLEEFQRKGIIEDFAPSFFNEDIVVVRFLL